MSLHQVIAGSGLPAELIQFSGTETDPTFVEPPLSIQPRPDVEEQLTAFAQHCSLNRNHLKRLAISAFLDRAEKDGKFFILPIERRT